MYSRDPKQIIRDFKSTQKHCAGGEEYEYLENVIKSYLDTINDLEVQLETQDKYVKILEKLLSVSK